MESSPFYRWAPWSPSDSSGPWTNGFWLQVHCGFYSPSYLRHCSKEKLASAGNFNLDMNTKLDSLALSLFLLLLLSWGPCQPFLVLLIYNMPRTPQGERLALPLATTIVGSQMLPCHGLLLPFQRLFTNLQSWNSLFLTFWLWLTTYVVFTFTVMYIDVINIFVFNAKTSFSVYRYVICVCVCVCVYIYIFFIVARKTAQFWECRRNANIGLAQTPHLTE